ncbi:Zn-ribbon domain-containing OB-fold protein [Hydrogenophaga sp.]|uniref:Zn-ribbon domain-containing OB-fold protein n=1 Tax=Hydrogenophaga sp. TaxID=1904254 RepID=UPI0027247395|nr:OB-fold domain-containing protein [Hydrogenophaga sp.]MDO9435378.1 OB-fold domain-containing protein [Hydrogenophaga sp.]
MIPPQIIYPDRNGPNAPHWRGAADGQLLIQQCGHCEHLRFPASEICPHCQSDKADWIEVRPTGRIVSWCRFHRAYFPDIAEQLPYTVLLVELDDGLRMYANPAIDDRHTPPEIGARVRAAFVRLEDDLGIVHFEPAT